MKTDNTSKALTLSVHKSAVLLSPLRCQAVVGIWSRDNFFSSYASHRLPVVSHTTFAAIFLPNRGKKGREDDRASDNDEGKAVSHKRNLLPRLDIHRVLSKVQHNLHHHLMGVKRHISRYQQGFRQHRESRRAAKKGHGKQKKPNAGQKRQHSKYGAQVDDLMVRALAYERQLDVRNAIQCYEAWSDATYLDEIHNVKFKEPLSTADKRAVNLKAKEYAEKALSLGEKTSLPEVAACVSIGRLALFSDNKAKVALAKEAREHAVVAIEKEPGSDLAHHLMGRWHWEMAQLNVVVRTLIRIAFGTALPAGTHSDALESYATACKLNPSRLIHRVELGRAYHKLGKREAAWRELEAAILLDQEDINAHLQKIDADVLLKDLRRDAKRFGWKSTAEASESAIEEMPKPNL